MHRVRGNIAKKKVDLRQQARRQIREESRGKPETKQAVSTDNEGRPLLLMNGDTKKKNSTTTEGKLNIGKGPTKQNADKKANNDGKVNTKGEQAKSTAKLNLDKANETREVEQWYELARLFQEVKLRMDHHTHELLGCDHALSQIELLTKSVTARLPDCQMLWRIDGFSEKHDEGLPLHSPSFMTHDCGYKMAVSLCPRGDGKAKGKFMSIFFCILRGDHDALLPWPFSHPITFTLLDQSPDGGKHISAKFTPNPVKDNMPFLGRPESFRNMSLGIPRFVPLDVAYAEDYVKDDSIFIKVEVAVQGLLRLDGTSALDI